MSRRHIHFEGYLDVALFAGVFVVMVLIVLAGVPLVDHLFPGN
jgi:hypothetical protein